MNPTRQTTIKHKHLVKIPASDNALEPVVTSGESLGATTTASHKRNHDRECEKNDATGEDESFIARVVESLRHDVPAGKEKNHADHEDEYAHGPTFCCGGVFSMAFVWASAS